MAFQMHLGDLHCMQISNLQSLNCMQILHTESFWGCRPGFLKLSPGGPVSF